MDKIGKYKGIMVYEVTLPGYVNGRLYKDEDNMYLIDGELIYKNEVFAKYDGNFVTEYDPYERVTYYTVPKIEAKVIMTEDEKGVKYETVPVRNSKNETKTPEDILVGVYDTDYFSSMMDIDAFLKANS